MDSRIQKIGAAQRARRHFSTIVYCVTILWILVGLAQWVLLCVLKDLGAIFVELPWMCAIFFGASIIFIIFFIFFEQVRFIPGLNAIFTIIIVECAIIGLFGLAVKSAWPDLLVWFFVCFLLMFLFIILGIVIPHDLTLDVVILFVIAFVFLILTVFLIMLFMLTDTEYSYFLYQALISAVVLMFVMYHAQTINGGRFAEMRVTDYFLATLILFYDFLVLFLLTFYVQ
ncbi:CG12209, partial [Drosophila busckii]